MKDISKYNIGWAFLKLWMCWEVVMVHAWNSDRYPISSSFRFVDDFRAYAVPVFMLITFFLTARHFVANDVEWLKRRFFRLCLPFLFWSVLAFITWRLLCTRFPAFAIDSSTGAFWTESCHSTPEPVVFEYLVLQALGTTRTLGSQMWFQAVLVILTGFFAVFFRLVKPKFVVAGLMTLFAIGFMMDYSGLNFKLFNAFRYEVRNPLGRIFPMLPYAVTGLLAGMSSKSFDGYSLCRRWYLVALGAVATVFLVNFDVFVSPKGFYYKGLKMFFVALALVAVFRFLPLGKLPVSARRFIVWAGSYSMGVYFAHIYTGKILEELVFPHVCILPRSFSGGCIVFVVSFVLCYLVSLIPNRNIRALVR